MNRSEFLKVLGLGTIAVPAILKSEPKGDPAFDLQKLKNRVTELEEEVAYLEYRFGTKRDVREKSPEDWSDTMIGQGDWYMSTARKNVYGKVVEGQSWSAPVKIS